MIKIYDQTSYLEVDDNSDLETVLTVMDDLDDIYKKRSEDSKELISINKRTLFYSTLYVLENNDSEDRIEIVTDSLRFFDKFTSQEQDKLVLEISKQIDNKSINDEMIISFVEKNSNLIF